MSQMKPRSGLVTDGLERAPARGMLRAVGMTDDDWVKPQIGIASSWNEITPCNLSLDRLAKASKQGVIDAGGFPMQFGTISVSDGISMGHEGMHFSLVSREVIADSVETVMQAERFDGMVTFAGCDKSLPGMMMAAARIDVASVFVYAIGPPSTASGATCPTHRPVDPPEKRPSVKSRVDLPRPAPLIAPVIINISRIPGPPFGPS